jgi:hypothetical protein
VVIEHRFNRKGIRDELIEKVRGDFQENHFG